MSANWVRDRRRPETGRETWVQKPAPDGGLPWLRYYPTDVGMSLVWNPETLHPCDLARRERGLLCFAQTGGGGTHFSFLPEPGRPLEACPVVVTFGAYLKPDEEATRHVVAGANLREFLGLGLPTGYFTLENLILRPEGFAESYPEDGHFVGSEGERQPIADLKAAFGLTPWRREQVTPRLAELKAAYAARLRQIG